MRAKFVRIHPSAGALWRLFSRLSHSEAEAFTPQASFAPSGATRKGSSALHGLRVGGLRRASAPPVATPQRPAGVFDNEPFSARFCSAGPIGAEECSHGWSEAQPVVSLEQ